MTISRRHFNQSLIAALGLALLPPMAARADLVEGRDWRAITPPQPSDSPEKIEVLEFFSYGCSHCMAFNPIVKEWARKLPSDVAFRRVPVTFGRTAWETLARLFLALEIGGDLEQLDQKVFEALHQERARIYTRDAILDWVGKQGADPERFASVYDSFDLQTRLMRAEQLAERYRIDAVPTLTVGGRFAVLGHAAQGFEGLLAIADELILESRALAAAVQS